MLVTLAALALGAGGWYLAAPRAEPEPSPALTSIDQSPRKAAGRAGWITRSWLSDDEARISTGAGLVPPMARSIIDVRTPLRHGEFIWSDEGVPPGPLTVWVDLRRQMASVYRGPVEIGTAVVVFGHPGKESPQGRFAIREKVRDYHSRAYDAPMPYSLFITTTGVALHGSPMSARHATHGCVGLPMAFARLLFDAAQDGDTVVIVRSAGPARGGGGGQDT